jgi:AcrR family transcriptional regulator
VPRGFRVDEKQRIRDALVRAARESLGRGGLRRTPVEQLCRAAGISKGAFYLFFESKEQLMMELVRETETELRAGLLALADGDPPVDRLHAVLSFLFQAVGQHPLLLALSDPEELAWLSRSLPPGQLEAAQADDDAFLAALLRRLRDQGRVGDVADTTFAGLAGAAFALATQRHIIGVDRHEAVMALVVDGLVRVLSPPGR